MSTFKKEQRNTASLITAFLACGCLMFSVLGVPIAAKAAMGTFFSDEGGRLEKEKDIIIPYGVIDAAAGDFGGDGIDELVTIDIENNIKVLRAEGTGIFDLIPSGGKVGSVAVADVVGDSGKDIILGAAHGEKSAVQVYVLGKLERLFSPYGDFPGGVVVAAGDVDGNGQNEIVTIPLGGGGSHLKVWNNDGSLRGEVFIFPQEYDKGSRLAMGDIDGDGRDEIVVTKREGSGEVVILNGDTLEQKTQFISIGNGFQGGLRVAIKPGSIATSRIFVIPESGGGPHAQIHSSTGTLISASFTREETYRGQTILVNGNFAAVNSNDILALSAEGNEPNVDRAKEIIIDTSEQRLYAYEYGKLINTFLVSTGLNNTTPMGEFKIYAKPYIVHYAGPGYDLGRIPYNLRFFPHIYIHYAPWHNNFGRPVSRGCVNVNLESAKWIYDWAEIGTVVAVVK